MGQHCDANFVMADSAALAKEGKLAEFVEQAFGSKLGDDGNGIDSEGRPALTPAVGDVVRHKAWSEGLVTEAGPAELVIDFDGVERRFAIPEAFDNGYLTLAED